MSEYFQKSKSLGENVKVKLSLSNYRINPNLKNGAVVDVSDFFKKTDLANLKCDVDKSDIHKLKNVLSSLSNLRSKVDKLDIAIIKTSPVDLSKLSNAVKMVLLKK